MTDEIAPAADAPELEKKTLTPEQWSECRALYELGEARMPELSERFGVSKAAISKHFKSNGVVFGSRRKEIDDKVAAAAATERAAAPAKVVASFESTRKAKIEETKTEAYADARLIAQATRKILIDALKPGGPGLGAMQGEMKALRMAAAIIGQTRQDCYAILQADKEIDQESLPELIIKDLTDERIKELANAGDEGGLDLPDIDLPDDPDADVVIETT